MPTLCTLFAEVVIILNSRPLTPSSDDPNDCEPLTQSHFLLQHQNLALPPGLFVHGDLYRRKQWRGGTISIQLLLEKMGPRVHPGVQQRKKWVCEKGNLSIRDLVLVVDDNSPRGRWLLGRVVKTFPGHDHCVRVAKIKTKNSTLIRPISKLFVGGSSLKFLTSKITLNHVRTLFCGTVYGLFTRVIEPTDTRVKLRTI